MKKIIKNTFSFLFNKLGFWKVIDVLYRNPYIIALCGHQIGSEIDSMHISEQALHAIIISLKNKGFKFITEVGGVKEKSVLLTFDDGYKSILEKIIPILDKLKVKALFFMCTDYIGKENYLTWEGIKKIKDKGHKIGLHGKSHINYGNAKLEKIKTDFLISEEELKKHDIITASFAYPFGWETSFTKETVEYIYTKGYKQFTTKDKVITNINEQTFGRFVIDNKSLKHLFLRVFLSKFRKNSVF